MDTLSLQPMYNVSHKTTITSAVRCNVRCTDAMPLRSWYIAAGLSPGMIQTIKFVRKCARVEGAEREGGGGYAPAGAPGRWIRMHD